MAGDLKNFSVLHHRKHHHHFCVWHPDKHHDPKSKTKSQKMFISIRRSYEILIPQRTGYWQ